MKDLQRAAYWAAAPLVCLLVWSRSFQAWFRGDDFTWLSLGRNIHTFADLLEALFRPYAQGTIRPWSERVFFMAGFELFGLDSAPFRLIIFATQFANLTLVASIGARLTGSRAAGLCAALLWAVHSSALEPLGWICVYNQVLCAFFLLLAFHFLLRVTETGERRYEIAMWIVFLLGFGAQELNFVFPALAAVYCFFCARNFLRRTLPMFLVSGAYFAAHMFAAPLPMTGDYAMHFTGAMFRTLARYWTWSAGPSMLWTPWNLPPFAVLIGVAAITVALAVFVISRFKQTLPLVAWYLITIAPVLPLRDHRMPYYAFIPMIGICWLAGWALVEAWRRGSGLRLTGVALTVLYLAMMLPRSIASAEWNYHITKRVQNLVEGLAGARQLHPGKAIVLDGVDAEMFWNGVLDRPSRLIGIDHLYLTPGTEHRIPPQPNLGDVSEFVLPAEAVRKGIERGEVVVYDVSSAQLRNITGAYAAAPAEVSAPMRLDVVNPLTAYLLGPEWYSAEDNHRWMPKRATLRIGAPAAPGRRLYLSGTCPEEQLHQGPLSVTVALNGRLLPSQEIRPGQTAFELSWPLPDSVLGLPSIEVSVEVSRTIRIATDSRELGLAFGTFAVR